jgi:hypothetical protein
VTEVEALLDRHLDRDAAFDAWADGYSASGENIESEWPREVAPEVSLIIRCVDRFSVVFYENFPCCPA